jgi:hypothetical protein
MKIEQIATTALTPYARNSRTHSADQVRQIAASITEFGFTNPVLIDADGGIIAGHGRVMAANQLGLQQVPCIRLGHLTDAQKRAYVIADNKLAENAGWDAEMLALEMQELSELNFNVDLLGCEPLDEKPKQEPQVEDWELTDCYEPFWLVVRGPIEHMAEVKEAITNLGITSLEVEVSA